MRLRTVTLPVIAAALAILPLAGLASAQPGDRDCADFSSQAEAQEALDATVGDPERLDANGNGQACENNDYGTTSPEDPAPTPPLPPADEPAPTENPAPAPAPAPAEDPAPNEDPAPDEDDVAAAPPQVRTPEPPAPPAAGQVSVIPRGGVDTGDGSRSATPLLLGGVVALGSLAAAARHRAHSA